MYDSSLNSSQLTLLTCPYKTYHLLIGVRFLFVLFFLSLSLFIRCNSSPVFFLLPLPIVLVFIPFQFYKVYTCVCLHCIYENVTFLFGSASFVFFSTPSSCDVHMLAMLFSCNFKLGQVTDAIVSFSLFPVGRSSSIMHHCDSIYLTLSYVNVCSMWHLPFVDIFDSIPPLVLSFSCSFCPLSLLMQ